MRVSTAEQVDGYGLDTQRAAISEFCRKHHLKLVNTFSDEGISGSNGLDARVGLAEALALIESRNVQGLLVFRLDRLARDLLLQETLLLRLRQAGAEVFSVSEPDIDSDDATRVLVGQVLGAISQYEAAVIKGGLLSGKLAKLNRNKNSYVGGRPPYGWRAEGKELVPDEKERATALRARQMKKQGLSLRQIGAQLDAEGLGPRHGTHWHPRTVTSIIQSSTSRRQIRN